MFTGIYRVFIRKSECVDFKFIGNACYLHCWLEKLCQLVRQLVRQCVRQLVRQHITN